MTAKKRAIRIIHRLDDACLKLLGSSRVATYGYQMPQLTDPDQLRQLFIKQYFKTQPSPVQLMLLKIYVNTRHAIKVILRTSLGWLLRLVNEARRR